MIGGSCLTNCSHSHYTHTEAMKVWSDPAIDDSHVNRQPLYIEGEGCIQSSGQHTIHIHRGPPIPLIVCQRPSPSHLSPAPGRAAPPSSLCPAPPPAVRQAAAKPGSLSFPNHSRLPASLGLSLRFIPLPPVRPGPGGESCDVTGSRRTRP